MFMKKPSRFTEEGGGSSVRVLMLTPRVDPEEDVFGFIYNWVREIGRNVDRLVVLTVKAGKRKYIESLPENIEVYEMGNRKGISRIIYAAKVVLNSIMKEKIDVIFTHMYVDFVFFVTPFAKIFRKPVVMFYAHGAVSFKLKIAAHLVDAVATSSEKGFRISTPKLNIIGQGIDTFKFKPSDKQPKEKIILYVGRLSRVKNIDVLIRSLKHIDYNDFKVVIVGGLYEKDEKYLEHLNDEIEKSGMKERISLINEVPHDKIVEYYQQATVFVNPSTTGSLDKTVLEAMACGIPVVTCNDAFLDVFDDEAKLKCFFRPGDEYDLAKKIEYFLKNDDKALRRKLRDAVIMNHSIRNLARNLTLIFEKVKRKS